MKRKKVTAAAKPLVKTWAATLARPFSNAWSGERASSRLSRAAIAPPSIPTMSVRCWTMALEPEMPVLNTVRRMISTTGSSSIVTSGITSRRFSPWRARRRPRERVLDSGKPTG